MSTRSTSSTPSLALAPWRPAPRPPVGPSVWGQHQMPDWRGCVYSGPGFLVKGGRPWLPVAHWPSLGGARPPPAPHTPRPSRCGILKRPRFTSIHESVTSASPGAPLRWAGGPCGWNPAPCSPPDPAARPGLTLASFRGSPEPWSGMCRNSSSL